MSSPVNARLDAALKKIDRPGSFCVSGSVPAVMPGLDVAGLGPIGLPLTARQAKELKGVCEQAPYGKGTETVVDKNVRRVWHLKPESFALTNPDWLPFLDETIQKVRDGLGLERQRLEAHLYDLLLYEPGGFFLPHRDGEKLARMVATLVIVLPSAHQGGELIVRHEGEERTIDFSTPDGNLFRNHFAAFYADCEHEIRPLREGYRLCLVYNLTLAKSKKAIAAPRSAEHVEKIVPILREWAGMDEPRKLVVTLEHQYTQEGLTWDALKGVDAVKAKVLAEAAGRAECEAHLALLTFHESGSAEYTGGYRGGSRYRRGYDDEDDDEGPYEMGEVFDSELSAAHWSDSTGRRVPTGEMDVEESELVDPDALESGTPREEFEGYTGNAGMTLDRWYQHGAIFLWPRKRRFQITCRTGSRSASEALEMLVGQWRKAEGEEAAGLRAECLEFAGIILGGWHERSHTGYSSGKPEPDKLLKSLAIVDDPRLIGTYLLQVVARDVNIEPGKALVRVCEKHGWGTFRPELEAVFRGTTRPALERNARLLEVLCSSSPRKKAGWSDLCESLGRTAITALVRIDGESEQYAHWRKEPNSPILLAALTRALVATDQIDVLSQLVDHILATPEKYPLLGTHVAALTDLRPWLAKHVGRPSPPLIRWVEACVAQLEALTAQEPQPPADLRRDAPIASTRDVDAAELKRFLEDPREGAHRFRVEGGRRSSLEHLIRQYHLDLKTATETKGRPYTLVCTKTTASYEARLKKYRQDLEHLATIRAIRAKLPG
jgi:hypothetical protein